MFEQYNFPITLTKVSGNILVKIIMYYVKMSGHTQIKIFAQFKFPKILKKIARNIYTTENDGR